MCKELLSCIFLKGFSKIWLYFYVVQSVADDSHWSLNANGVPKGEQTLPILLWWTERLYPHFETNETEIQCHQGSCMTTVNRQYFNDVETSAFLFYGTDLKIEDLPLPRKPNHDWALFHEESPLNNYLFSHEAGIKLFNYTSTFRSDSDYPLTTQFLPTLGYLTDRQPLRLKEKNRLRHELNLSPVLYVQTHCFVPSDRDRYVSELSRFIPIDSYGMCLNNKTLPTHLSNTSMYDDEQFMTFIARYKFHIAFENAICDDYVTEKLYRALHVGSVPIYRGAKTVNLWTPNSNSVIVADHFQSPEKLAKFIKKVDEDDAMYLSFLEFKTKGISNDFLREHMDEREWGVNDINRLDFINGFECYICDRVLQRRRAAEKFNSLPRNIASNSHMGCPEPDVSIGALSDLPSDDEWLKQGWLEDYRYAKALALALDQIVQTGQNSSEDVYEMALKYMIN